MTSAKTTKEARVLMVDGRQQEEQQMKVAVTDCMVKLVLKLKAACELRITFTNQKA